MDSRLEAKFINLLEEKLKTYHFKKGEVALKGRVHFANFIMHAEGVNYNFFIRILPKQPEFEIYFKVEYTAISDIVRTLATGLQYMYTFTGKMIDFLEPENSDWFLNTSSVMVEGMGLNNEDDIIKLIAYIERRYIKAIMQKIIPQINSLEKLNLLLNNYDVVYDFVENEPKMYTLSGGMIFQSTSALILNTIFKNSQRDELVKLYSWLYYVIKDEDDPHKIILKKVLDYVILHPV